MARWFGIGMLLVAMALMLGAPAFAQEEGVASAEICEVIGCRDPFVSLVRATPPDKGADISQLRVVAIVWDAEGRYALIKFPDGKYYMYKEGMFLGLHEGKIEKISQDSVLVRENNPDEKGQPKSVDTYLKLRSEEQK